MSLASFLNRRKGELLLLLISIWATSCVVLNGFHLDDLITTYGYFPRAAVAFIADFALCLLLFVASFRRERRTAGVAGFLILSAVLVVISIAASTGESPYVDQEGNYLYFALVLIVVTAVGFLLTRTLAGSMAWFVVVAFVCSLIQAFYQSGELAMSVVALVSSLSLVVYRNFRLGVEGAQLSKQSSSGLAFITALIPVGVAAAIAAVVWFMVIAPLSPGVLDVKLFTEYRQLPIEEYVGTSQEHPQFNYDMTSQNTVDGDPYTTDDLRQDATSDTKIDAASALEKQTMQQQAGTGTGDSSGGGSKQAFSEESTDQAYDPISYQDEFPWATVWIIVAIVIILLVVAYFVIRRHLRMRRLRSYLALEPADQVKQLYRFILKHLDRIGFKQPEGMSLREFAITSARQMDMITEETKVSFRGLTETYVACVYGGIEPTEDEIVPFAAYYLRFWKAARGHLGNFKYFFKSFRL